MAIKSQESVEGRLSRKTVIPMVLTSWRERGLRCKVRNHGSGVYISSVYRSEKKSKYSAKDVTGILAELASWS